MRRSARESAIGRSCLSPISCARACVSIKVLAIQSVERRKVGQIERKDSPRVPSRLSENLADIRIGFRIREKDSKRLNYLKR